MQLVRNGDSHSERDGVVPIKESLAKSGSSTSAQQPLHQVVAIPISGLLLLVLPRFPTITFNENVCHRQTSKGHLVSFYYHSAVGDVLRWASVEEQTRFAFHGRSATQTRPQAPRQPEWSHHSSRRSLIWITWARIVNATGLMPVPCIPQVRVLYKNNAVELAKPSLSILNSRWTGNI
jgi:hypothetical protein